MMMIKPWQQKFDEAGHIASTLKMQSDASQFSFSFSLSYLS